MLDLDTFAEIWATITRHKLRTFLAALSVAWGVFMLIVLLAAGRGLENGAMDTFGGDALNSVWINIGMTSVAFAGQGPGRKIRFNNPDFDSLRGLGPDVEHADGERELVRPTAVRYHGRRSTFRVRGVVPDVRYLENTGTREGRLLDDDDVRERRKVAVLGPEVAKILFDDRSPLGEYIQIRDANFRVVGVYDDPGEGDDQRSIFVPVSIAQMMSGATLDLDEMGFTVADFDQEASQSLVKSMRKMLADRHHFAPEDERAVRFYNNLEFYAKVSRMFVWIRAFVWLVGIGTLLAGIVGVSNIMLISVKERTQEIGIRKAIGATPASILRMIVGESLLITGIAGYVGLAAGIGAVSLAARFMPPIKGLRDPSINFAVALLATALIVIAGTLAGLFPARQAATTQPISALRTE
jgi:putative ABC transport system permease protein